jgi:hypothetical protein
MSVPQSGGCNGSLRSAHSACSPLISFVWDVATLPAYPENRQGASLHHHHPGDELRRCRQRRAARTAPAWRADRDKPRNMHCHQHGVDASRERIRREDHLPSPLRPDGYSCPGGTRAWNREGDAPHPVQPSGKSRTSRGCPLRNRRGGRGKPAGASSLSPSSRGVSSQHVGLIASRNLFNQKLLGSRHERRT